MSYVPVVSCMSWSAVNGGLSSSWHTMRVSCVVLWSQVVGIAHALSSKAIVTQSLCRSWQPGVAVHCAVQSYCVDLLVRLLVCCLGRWACWSVVKKLLTTSLMSGFSVWTNGNYVGHLWFSTIRFDMVQRWIRWCYLSPWMFTLWQTRFLHSNSLDLNAVDCHILGVTHEQVNMLIQDVAELQQRSVENDL